MLDFKEATVGKRVPIAWQMHSKGLFDEYKDETPSPRGFQPR